MKLLVTCKKAGNRVAIWVICSDPGSFPFTEIFSSDNVNLAKGTSHYLEKVVDPSEVVLTIYEIVEEVRHQLSQWEEALLVVEKEIIV